MAGRIILLLTSFCFVAACERNNSLLLPGTWVCNGNQIEYSTEIFYQDGRYYRYIKNSIFDTTSPEFYQGYFKVDGHFLSIQVRRPESGVQKNRLLRYKILRLNQKELKLSLYSKGQADSPVVKVCRVVFAASPGWQYQRSLNQTLNASKAELNAGKSSMINPGKAGVQNSYEKNCAMLLPGSSQVRYCSYWNENNDTLFSNKIKSDFLFDKSDVGPKKTLSSKRISPRHRSIDPPAKRKNAVVLLPGIPIKKGRSHSGSESLRQLTRSEKLEMVESSYLNSISAMPDQKTGFLEKTKKSLLKKIGRLDSLRRNNLIDYQIIKAVAQSISQNILIESIRKKEGVYSISGKSGNHAQIRRFTADIKKSSYLKNVKISGLKRKRNYLFFKVQFRQRRLDHDYQFISRYVLAKEKSMEDFCDQEASEIESLYYRLLYLLPVKSKSETLLSDLYYLGAESKLKFLFMNAGNFRDTGAVAYLPVRFSLRGNFNHFMKFMNILTRMRYTVEVMRLSMIRQRVSRRSDLLINVRLRLYVRASRKLSRRYSVWPDSGQYVRFIPYKITELENTDAFSNPFSGLQKRGRIGCDGPFTAATVRQLKLVAVLDSDGPIAVFQLPNGTIFRVRHGVCLAKNIRVAQISRNEVRLISANSKKNRLFRHQFTPWTVDH